MDQQVLGTWTDGELADAARRISDALGSWTGGHFMLETRVTLENELAEIRVQQKDRAERAARGDVGAAAPEPERWDGVTVRIPPRYIP